MGCNLCPVSQVDVQSNDDRFVIQSYRHQRRRSSFRISRSVSAPEVEESVVSGQESLGNQQYQRYDLQQLGSQPGVIDLNAIFDIYLNIRANSPQNQSLQSQSLIQGFTNFLQAISSGQPYQGLTQSELDQLPQKKAEHSDTTCSICHEEILKGQQQLLLKCYHSYHTACLKNWLVRSKRCPMCRQDVV